MSHSVLLNRYGQDRSLKFIRRNRTAAVFTAFLLLALLGGLAGILWQARVADLQRKRAEAQTADTRRLTNSLLFDLYDAVKPLPGSTPVQRIIVTKALSHLDRLAADASSDPGLKLDLADAYIKLGNLQGNPYEQNLGDPARRQWRAHLAETEVELGTRLWKAGQRSEGEQLTSRGLAVFREIITKIPFSGQHRPFAQIILDVLAELIG